jgi:hypothetical protein
MANNDVDLSKYRTTGIRASMDGPRPAQPPGLGRVSATPGMARANLSRSSMPAASMANHYGEQRVNNLPGPPPAGKEQLARLEHRSISLTRVSKNPESRIRELQRNSMAGQVGRTSLGVGRISRTSDSSAPEDRPADVQNLKCALAHSRRPHTCTAYRLSSHLSPVSRFSQSYGLG